MVVHLFFLKILFLSANILRTPWRTFPPKLDNLDFLFSNRSFTFCQEGQSKINCWKEDAHNPLIALVDKSARVKEQREGYWVHKHLGKKSSPLSEKDNFFIWTKLVKIVDCAYKWLLLVSVCNISKKDHWFIEQLLSTTGSKNLDLAETTPPPPSLLPGGNPNSLRNIYSQDIPKGRPGTFQQDVL